MDIDTEIEHAARRWAAWATRSTWRPSTLWDRRIHFLPANAEMDSDYRDFDSECQMAAPDRVREYLGRV
jgi:hypothetical protein